MTLGAGSADEEDFSGPAGRALLVGRLSESLARLAVQKHSVVVVVALGLDRLSQINATWGYDTGDRLLAEVEERLAACIHKGETVARVGGDQFVLVCETSEGEDVEAEFAELVIDAIAGQYSIDQHTVYITASIGIAGTADADDDAEALLSAAESARAEARRNGGRRWERANQVMRIRVREQLRTEQALYGAIDNDELSVHYQPIFDLVSGATVAFEALARWRSPLLGSIPPTHFIPRAEETGLIVPIGHWVLDEIVRHWTTWKPAGTSAVAPAITVNVSSIQLRLDLDALARHLLEAADALPGELWIEITESMLLEDPEGARATLTHLKALGLRLMIDDFGTGYSSLSQLRLLPVDTIKIDRVFIGRIHESPQDRAIVQAMIQLAHAFEILAIAEGVETEPQLAVLHEMSCDQVQGFLLSPAVPFEQVETNLQSGRAFWNRPLLLRDRPGFGDPRSWQPAPPKRPLQGSQ